MHDDTRPAMRIAIVGSGISGLGAALRLAEHHRVTLFEADRRPGGHTHTVDVTLDGARAAVDTGFLVFNERTYPELIALFGELGVPTAQSDMSFSVSIGPHRFEWCGSNLATLLAQPRNALRPSFWRMINDILRFNRRATALATGASHAAALDEPLAGFLRREGYSDGFRDHYLLPMAAAIWSCPTRTMLEYPLATFVHFCHNHGLLQILDRPNWMTVKGGGRSYVRKMLAGLDDVRVNAPVRSVARDREGVRVHTDAGQERFDAVVFACHSDQALAILGSAATPEERRILGAVRYQPNVAYLHTDTALLPRRQKVWSAWNYLAGKGAPDARPVSVSYLINRLQPLPFATPVVVSLNPFTEPAADKTFRRIEYAHPVFDRDAIDAQAALPALQGRNRSWFAGAWTGYGFHEDGLKSAVAVVEAMGVEVPWRRGRVAASAARRVAPVEAA